MTSLWERVMLHNGIGAESWEQIVTRTWFLFTPPILNVAAVLMLILLLWRGRWRSRMARASFGLVSSYAMIMDRFLYLQWSQSDALPQPWALMLWTYAFIAAVYFGYALAREWLVPFAFWIVRFVIQTVRGNHA